MIELAHQLPEPEELSQHRMGNPGGSWDAVEFATARSIVRRQLNLEQVGHCVYCETELGEDGGHVEHIKSKDANPTLTFVYANLAHSCHGPGHCGHHKGRQALPIEPRPGCNRFFALMALDGQIVPSAGLNPTEAERAEQTVRILGLNVPSLSRQRQQFANAILYLEPEDKAAFITTIPFRWVLRRFPETLPD